MSKTIKKEHRFDNGEIVEFNMYASFVRDAKQGRVVISIVDFGGELPTRHEITVGRYDITKIEQLPDVQPKKTVKKSKKSNYDICELDLSTRVINHLLIAEISSIKKLKKMGDKEIVAATKNLGEKSLLQIREALKKHGEQHG